MERIELRHYPMNYGKTTKMAQDVNAGSCVLFHNTEAAYRFYAKVMDWQGADVARSLKLFISSGDQFIRVLTGWK